MQEPFSIITILLKAIFVGFGFTVPVISLIKTSNLKAVEFKQLFVLTAVQTLRVAGILFFLITALYAYSQYSHMSGLGGNDISLSFPANYWLIMFYSPLLYLLISQLFWIKKLYHRKPALIVMSLLLLILPSQFLALYVMNQDNEFRAAFQGIKLNWINLGTEFVLNQIVFIFIVVTIILTTGKFKTKKT